MTHGVRRGIQPDQAKWHSLSKSFLKIENLAGMSGLANAETEQDTLLMEETGMQSTPDTSSPTTEETSSSQGTGNMSNLHSEMMATAAANLNSFPPAHFGPKTDDWNH